MSKQNNMRSINWRQRGWRSVGWKNSDVTVEAPADSILHWDADIDAFSEQTGGVHTFNHAVLSPQYQRNADGSYTDVGAKPAVDVFDGEKWLRSCGAVTNLLTNSKFEGGISGSDSVPASAPTGWSLGAVENYVVNYTDGLLGLTATNGKYQIYQLAVLQPYTTYRYSSYLISDGVLRIPDYLYRASAPVGLTEIYECDGVPVGVNYVPPSGPHQVAIVFTTAENGGTIVLRYGIGAVHAVTGSGVLSNPQLTATAYPLPYVPTTTAGPVTQPASNATTTNGCWFALPDGSPLWQALTGQPLTLATRVRMGVGSEDNITGDPGFLSCSDKNAGIQFSRFSLKRIIQAYDGVNSSSSSSGSVWNRYAIINRITQVNTAGTQFRVGYMIEGTHTAIQWSSWVAFDGSFNPSTLYRLMLGYDNPYPMWFNKITAWKKQATDAEILEAMA